MYVLVEPNLFPTEADTWHNHFTCIIKFRTWSTRPVPTTSAKSLSVSFDRLLYWQAPVGVYLQWLSHREDHLCWWCAGAAAQIIITMWYSLDVITKQLSNSEQPHGSFWMLPTSPKLGECKVMCSQVLRDNFTGASEYSRSCWIETKNILKSV